MARKRWPMVVGGVLAAGAVAGTATVLVRRHRTKRTWEEYGNTGITTGESAKAADSKVNDVKTGKSGAE